MTREAPRIGDGTVVNAVFTPIRELRNRETPDVKPVPDDLRIDGKTCLVTGANSGLGRAAAVDLARRGGNMILACRSGHTETCSEIKCLSGSETVEMLEVDLADLESVHRFCDLLRQRGIRIEIALLNAGLMTRRSRKTPQGYEMMFAVHFLSNRVMFGRWLQDGVMRPSHQAGTTPRIVFITSESHRSSYAMDFACLSAFTEFGLRESLKYYGLTKLALCTFATELSRRLNPDEGLGIAVHAMCPGGVASNIARDTPMLLKPTVNPVLRHFFQSPEEAVTPVVYLCCSEEAGNASGICT